TVEMYAGLVARAIENVRLHARATARMEELQRLQGELVARERLAALGEAAAVMAHEVRNPIAAILNAAALLRRDADAGGASGAMCTVIAEEAGRLERLVCDLLDLGRPLAPHIGAVDLLDLFERTRDLLASRGELGNAVI